MGGQDASGLRIRDQAAPAVHAPPDACAVHAGPRACPALAAADRAVDRTPLRPCATPNGCGLVARPIPAQLPGDTGGAPVPRLAGRCLEGHAAGGRTAPSQLERRARRETLALLDAAGAAWVLIDEPNQVVGVAIAQRVPRRTPRPSVGLRAPARPHRSVVGPRSRRGSIDNHLIGQRNSSPSSTWRPRPRRWARSCTCTANDRCRQRGGRCRAGACPARRSGDRPVPSHVSRTLSAAGRDCQDRRAVLTLNAFNANA